jgi:hypothetical protein
VTSPAVRQSDRYITPAVVVALIVVGGLVVLGVFGACAWLTSIGRDPEPLVRLVGTLVAAATGLGTFVLQLANRATVAKTERNTGGARVSGLRGGRRHAQAGPPHAAYDDDTVQMSAAPAPRGS